MQNQENIENNSVKPPIKKIGKIQEVWDGLAEQTVGHLRKEDLVLNKRGKPASKRKIEAGKRAYMNLKKYKEEHQNKGNEDLLEKKIDENINNEIKEEIKENPSLELVKAEPDKFNDMIPEKKEQKPNDNIIIIPNDKLDQIDREHATLPSPKPTRGRRKNK